MAPAGGRLAGPPRFGVARTPRGARPRGLCEAGRGRRWSASRVSPGSSRSPASPPAPGAAAAALTDTGRIPRGDDPAFVGRLVTARPEDVARDRHSLVADLRSQARALRLRNAKPSVRASAVTRSRTCRRASPGRRSGPITVRTYRLDHMAVKLRPAQGQGEPIVVARVNGEAQDTVYQGTPPKVVQRNASVAVRGHVPARPERLGLRDHLPHGREGHRPEDVDPVEPPRRQELRRRSPPGRRGEGRARRLPAGRLPLRRLAQRPLDDGRRSLARLQQRRLDGPVRRQLVHGREHAPNGTRGEACLAARSSRTCMAVS